MVDLAKKSANTGTIKSGTNTTATTVAAAAEAQWLAIKN